MTAGRFSAGMPQVLPDAAPDLVAAFARRAEQLGFDGLWTLDSAPGGPTASQPVLDALHALTYAAAVTRSVRLGTAVVVLARRNPVLLAREIATLDQLSGGRVVVAVGRGAEDETVAALGLPTDHPYGRLIEGVAVMRAAWSEGRSTHSGALWSFEGVGIAPKPVQRPGPPIWFGAAGPKMLERTAQFADGWVGAGSSSAHEVFDQLQTLDAALRAAGRDPAAFPRAKRVYVWVGTEAAGRQRFAAVLDGLYEAPGLADRTAVVGTEDECAGAMVKLLEAGVGELILTPMHDHLDQLERLAAVVELVRAA